MFTTNQESRQVILMQKTVMNPNPVRMWRSQDSNERRKEKSLGHLEKPVRARMESLSLISRICFCEVQMGGVALDVVQFKLSR